MKLRLSTDSKQTTKLRYHSQVLVAECETSVHHVMNYNLFNETRYEQAEKK